MSDAGRNGAPAGTPQRVRLRPAYSQAELAEIYAYPWAFPGAMQDHRLRINTTIAVGRWFGQLDSVADLSCGDGEIALGLGAACHYLGDFAHGYPFQGPIEETIQQVPDADLFVCSETLEHVDDPDAVLRAIRPKCRYLLASTPIGEWNPEHNPEHYWGWTLEAFGMMLEEADFRKVVLVTLWTPPPYLYDYQIWLCE